MLTAAPDPIFAAIEDCRQKDAAWQAASETSAPNEPELGEAYEAALQALARMQPTTMAGAGAMLGFVRSVEAVYLGETGVDGLPFWQAVTTVVDYLNPTAPGDSADDTD